jgi:hypothetical protein
MKRGDLLYTAFIVIGALFTLLLLWSHNVYLFGHPATLYIFTQEDCIACSRFVTYAEKTLGEEGFHILVFYVGSGGNGTEAFDMLKSMGLPGILPTTIVSRKGEARGIVIGGFEGKPFWIMLRDTPLETTTLIPVYQYGDLVGYVSSDECLVKMLPKMIEEHSLENLYRQCSGNYTYIYIGKPGYETVGAP